MSELTSMRDYAHDQSNMGCAKDHHGRPSLLLTYAQLELSLPDQPRVIESNEDFVAVVPWWAVWPFEVLLLPHRRQIPSLVDMTDKERLHFASLLGNVTCRLDNIFDCSFPYSMGLHQRPTPSPEPTQDDVGEYAQFHVHFYPPLLRSASVRKFLVGFELMGEPQRDLTAEQAASRIRSCDTVHYLQRAEVEKNGGKLADV